MCHSSASYVWPVCALLSPMIALITCLGCFLQTLLLSPVVFVQEAHTLCIETLRSCFWTLPGAWFSISWGLFWQYCIHSLLKFMDHEYKTQFNHDYSEAGDEYLQQKTCKFYFYSKFECCLCDCSYRCSMVSKCSITQVGYLLVPQCQTTVAFKYSIKHVRCSWVLIVCLA